MTDPATIGCDAGHTALAAHSAGASRSGQARSAGWRGGGRRPSLVFLGSDEAKSIAAESLNV